MKRFWTVMLSSSASSNSLDSFEFQLQNIYIFGAITDTQKPVNVFVSIY